MFIHLIDGVWHSFCVVVPFVFKYMVFAFQIFLYFHQMQVKLLKHVVM